MKVKKPLKGIPKERSLKLLNERKLKATPRENKFTKSEKAKNIIKLKATIENLSLRFINKGFENFEVNKRNQKQVEECKNYLSGGMLISGGVGTGKTHLAVSMLREFPMARYLTRPFPNTGALILRHYDKWYSVSTKMREVVKTKETPRLHPAKTLIISASDFFTYYRQSMVQKRCEVDDVRNLSTLVNNYSYNTQDLNSILEKYTCICLDDLGAKKLTENDKSNLYAFVNNRYECGIGLIITTNLTIQELNEIEPRIASRIAEMGKIIELNGEDYRLKISK